jgi:predicted NAD-dependent protein-ADP-ribosyltransferase YbiA (DUF1768 family)
MQRYQIFTIFRRFLMASTNANLTQSSLVPSEVELINRVHSHFPNNEPNKFFYFYETASPFSNFHPCSFSENGIQFNCSEQYMMYQKASKEKTNFLNYQTILFISKNYSVMTKQLKQFLKQNIQLTVKH